MAGWTAGTARSGHLCPGPGPAAGTLVRVNGSRVGHEPPAERTASTEGDGGERQCVVFVHAHPDDEAIFTGGTMAQLAADGHRVVLVVCTGGELGLTTD